MGAWLAGKKAIVISMLCLIAAWTNITLGKDGLARQEQERVTSLQQALTLEAFVQLAFQENLGLQIEKHQFRSERATESSNFRKMLPSFSITTGGKETFKDTSEPTNETTSYASSLVMTQPIYQPSLMASWNKSKLNLNKADLNLDRVSQSLLFEVKQAWYNLLLVRVLYEEAVNSLERLKQHRQNAKAFYKSGKIWRNDLLQAEVRVSRGEQDVFAAKNQLVLAKSKVNLILNRDIYGPLNPLGKLEYMNFDGELQQYLDLAKSNRLEIKQGIIDIKMAGKDKEIAKAKSKPSVELKLSSSFSSLDLDYEDHNQQTTAALNLRWNFWQFGQTNREVHAANAKLRAKRLQLEQTKADITLEVQSAFLAVKESQYSLKVSEQALQQSLENFRVSQIRYKEQLGSSNDVLDAQDLLTQTRTDRFSALSRYLTALAQLDLAVGRATSF